MSKTLKQFLEVYKPKSPDEQKFVDKHVTIKHKDRNGNGDDVFTASNIKTAKRKEERHGYDVGEDEKVYEEVEELDELSRGTLASYIKKAVPSKRGLEDASDRAHQKGHDAYTAGATKISDKLLTHSQKMYDKANRRGEGINKAADKLAKEEVEVLDEISAKTVDSYREKAYAQQPAGDDGSQLYKKRKAGRDMAFKKVTHGAKVPATNEEVESVEEAAHPHDVHFEKQTPVVQTRINALLRRGHTYPEAAKKAVGATPLKEMAPPGAKYERMVKHIKKGYAKGGLTDRERAIAYATAWKAKKANEGVEYVVPTLEEQLIEKIDSLSESNQETMLAVFEKLSEENKAKFVDYCDTPEGVNAMLDFAIDNRGE